MFASDSGGGGGGFGRAGGRGSLDVQVVPKLQRDRGVFDMITEVRRIGSRIPGVQVSADVPSPLGGGGGFGRGGNASVHVQIAWPGVPAPDPIFHHVTATLSALGRMDPAADVNQHSDS